MDPNATLRFIQNSMDEWKDNYHPDTSSHWKDQIDNSIIDLRKWLLKGGFAPDWDKFPEATRYYRFYTETEFV
jgi:hypothetical protein